MKISIGINGFKDYNFLKKREKLCIESLLKIKNKNSNIQLFNLCFDTENIHYEEFTTLNKLTKKSNVFIKDYFSAEIDGEHKNKKVEIINNSKELPSTKEIFDVLANTDCDYFAFLNNDIILSNRIFKEIEPEYDCYPVSRININDINTLDDVPEILEYSVHGFDVFLVKKKTWLEIRNNFDDFILGKFYWDTCFATIFNLLCKCKNLNKLPPVCFHIEHSNVSAQESIENYYCEHLFKKNAIVGHTWFSYVYDTLFKRQSSGRCKWYYPHDNEVELEKYYFNRYSTIELNYNKNFKKEENINGTAYDLFIPVAEKDEIKLQFVIEHALNNLAVKNIYVCSPHKIKTTISGVNYLNDNDVLDISDRSFINFRPNWTYQQFLKMFFQQGESEYYFALDSDTIILDQLPLFENTKPIWYYGNNQNHLPYCLFNKKAFNLNKSLTHTGIGDLGFFNKKITNSFLKYTNNSSAKELLYKIGKHLNTGFHFSEYETYANFVNEYYPDLYTFKQFDQYSCGKNLDQGQDWNLCEIEIIIDKAKKLNKPVLTIHSWKI